MVRRTETEDKESFLEHQCYNLNPDSWLALYKDKMLGQLDANDGGIPLTEDDMDDLDRYMEQQERAWVKQEQKIQDTIGGKHVMTGSQAAANAPLVWGQGQPDGQVWGPWR